MYALEDINYSTNTAIIAKDDMLIKCEFEPRIAFYQDEYMDGYRCFVGGYELESLDDFSYSVVEVDGELSEIDEFELKQCIYDNFDVENYHVHA